MQGVKGKVQAVTSKSLDIVTPSGVVHVKVEEPLTTYEAIPSDLSHVTSDSYVGVMSVKQADGTEVAKQIKIFPAELRGLSQGSNMIDAGPGAASQSRMTNGSVVRPTPSTSRMTNGTVQKQGATIVVRYQDGSQTVSVPAGVEVTQIVPKKTTLAAGDTVNAAVKKEADGTMATSKVYIIAPGSISASK
jgi:RNase P/RNase MRP subunit p29